ncbi:MAG: N-carbamoyl-D-amino-acid hydrolase [Pseudomonadota bacterium]
MRNITVGAAQMGPIQRADTKAEVVARMVALLDQAADAGCDLVVYPELALTTFFPRWDVSHPGESEPWYEASMPNADVQPLFDRAAEAGIALSFGYAEKTPEGRYFNTSILTDKEGREVGKYRKVHLPGYAEFQVGAHHQHLEKKYFEPGDLGFPVWRTQDGILGMCICNDRRWAETYRVMGLQGVEMVLLGYNTPDTWLDEDEDDQMFHHRLSIQAGAYANGTWVVAVAKAGVEDAHGLIGGTAIVHPNGRIVAEAKGKDDELVVHTCDLDAGRLLKDTLFNFAAHRRTEHYGRITSQTGEEVEV